MPCIVVYNEPSFGYVQKNSVAEAFDLPGDFFVFEEVSMIKQYGKFYRDPFKFYTTKNNVGRLKINELELIDSEIVFTYNSNFSIAFTVFDLIKKETYKIFREGLNHTKAFPLALSFLVKTMTEHPPNRNWQYFEVIQENIKLKEELKKLKDKLSN